MLLENERVQVLEARVEAGDTVPLHTHRWAGVQCFPSLADFVRRNESGEVVVDSRAIQLPDERPLVLPTFLTSTLGAPAAALGLIEGIDDGIVGAAKVASGPLAE